MEIAYRTRIFQIKIDNVTVKMETVDLIRNTQDQGPFHWQIIFWSGQSLKYFLIGKEILLFLLFYISPIFIPKNKTLSSD